MRREAAVSYCRKEGIAVMGYSPLAKGQHMDDLILNDLSKKSVSFHNPILSKQPHNGIFLCYVQIVFLWCPLFEQKLCLTCKPSFSLLWCGEVQQSTGLPTVSNSAENYDIHCNLLFVCPRPWKHCRYEKNVGQILARWSVQNGFITIPKSTRPERIEQNSHVFDWCLEDEDMITMVTYHLITRSNGNFVHSNVTPTLQQQQQNREKNRDALFAEARPNGVTLSWLWSSLSSSWVFWPHRVKHPFLTLFKVCRVIVAEFWKQHRAPGKERATPSPLNSNLFFQLMPYSHLRQFLSPRNRTMSCDNIYPGRNVYISLQIRTHTSNHKSSVFASAFTYENSCAISNEKNLRRCERA